MAPKMLAKNASGRYEYRTVGLGLLAGFIISLTYLSPSIYYSFPFTNVVTQSSTNGAPITSPTIDDPVISLKPEARNQNNVTHGSKPECDSSGSDEEVCEKSKTINLSVAEASNEHSSEGSVASTTQYDSPIVNTTEGNLKLDEETEGRSETNGDALVPTTDSSQSIPDQSENNTESEGENSVSNETTSNVSQNDNKIIVREDDSTTTTTTDATTHEEDVSNLKQSENNTESEDENSVPNETKSNVSPDDDKIIVPEEDSTATTTTDSTTLKEVASNPKQPDDSGEEAQLKETKITCDTAPYKRSDRCEMEGDIRVHGKSSSVVYMSSSSKQTWKIKPYARKADLAAMGNVRELLVAPSNGRNDVDAPPPPRCTISHSIPAVVFSSGGYCGNFFHDMSDVLVPLFQTTSRFRGEVQLLVADSHWWWNDKYGPVLKQLSRYEPIDLDNDDRVHCFPSLAVGLDSDGDMKIDASRCADGCSMVDFGRTLRAAYSLPRASPITITKKHRKKPRLFILSRGHTRRFVNAEEIARAAEEAGYEAVVGEAEHNVTRFAGLVNSCDVMVGVHGAGLTNFVFLPTDAIEIQVVPWGNLDWISENYYNKPARAMGLRYLEYRIKREESTLSEMYPAEDPVFADPNSIHRQGWEKLREIYLVKQNVRLDVRRFRPVLLEALRLLRSSKKH